MRERAVEASGATVTLTPAALWMVNNALNEVCNGISLSKREFEVQMRATRVEARALLAQVHATGVRVNAAALPASRRGHPAPWR